MRRKSSNAPHWRAYRWDGDCPLSCETPEPEAESWEWLEPEQAHPPVLRFRPPSHGMTRDYGVLVAVRGNSGGCRDNQLQYPHCDRDRMRLACSVPDRLNPKFSGLHSMVSPSCADRSAGCRAHRPSPDGVDQPRCRATATKRTTRQAGGEVPGAGRSAPGQRVQ